MGLLSGLAGLFSSGLSETVDSIGSAIDKNVTSDEERLALKNDLEQIRGGIKGKTESFNLAIEGEVTKRHEIDSKSDSWLSKNIRPMTLIFLMFNTMILVYLTIFAELSPDKVAMVKAWIPLLIALDVTAVGFYFGSRGAEKIKIPRY